MASLSPAKQFNLAKIELVPYSDLFLSSRSTPCFLSVLFVFLLGAQLALYKESFAVKPSADDFIALHQITRGETQGPLTFFKASDLGDYRPLQNLTFFVFGHFSEGHFLLSLRLLHFLSFIFYGSVAFLWIRVLNLNRIGAIAAACVVFFHPLIAGPLAGLDNYSRLVVSAWIWLGALVAYRWSWRSPVGIAMIAVCFTAGLGYMEYAIALIPLALLPSVWRSERRVHALIILASLTAVFSAYFLIRISGLVLTSSGADLLSWNLLAWMRNVATMLFAVLFFGNTIPVVLEPSLPTFAWLTFNVTLVAVAVGYGLWVRYRTDQSYMTTDEIRSPAFSVSRPPPLHFLSAAFAITFFPMLAMKHVSEIYLTPIILGLALLIGLSAQSWTTIIRPLRYAALVFAASQLFIASTTIRAKIAGINDAGERTEAMFHQLLKHLPANRDVKDVAIVFRKADSLDHDGYSVFVTPDEQLIQHGYPDLAVRWFRPDLGIVLHHLIVRDLSQVDFQSYDVVLSWDYLTKEFAPIAQSTRLP